MSAWHLFLLKHPYCTESDMFLCLLTNVLIVSGLKRLLNALNVNENDDRKIQVGGGFGSVLLGSTASGAGGQREAGRPRGGPAERGPGRRGWALQPRHRHQLAICRLAR